MLLFVFLLLMSTIGDGDQHNQEQKDAFIFRQFADMWQEVDRFDVLQVETEAEVEKYEEGIRIMRCKNQNLTQKVHFDVEMDSGG